MGPRIPERIRLLRELVDEALPTRGLLSPWSGAVVWELTGFVQPGERDELAQELLRLLASKKLHDLFAEDGRSCRECAIEALIDFSYPWALWLAPEDLVLARSAAEAEQ